jgi:hypothetical protein
MLGLRIYASWVGHVESIASARLALAQHTAMTHGCRVERVPFGFDLKRNGHRLSHRATIEGIALDLASFIGGV